ncbi:MAG: FHA domain-containing protein, partial [Deltaproteobacteria bacterium]|nr:FHA domain-containing protein [Deltaproteobacteria bacterium]
MARIYFYSDEGELLDVEISPNYPEISIGRQAACEIRSAGQSVSRRHARVYFDQGQYILQDLNSSNGTFYAGERLPAGDSAVLEDDALFACGQFELRLAYDEADLLMAEQGWEPPAAAIAPPPPPQGWVD